MSRPQKSGDDKRDVIIRVRVTPAEKTQLLKSASVAGLSLSDFLRQKSINATPLFRRATPERAAFIQGLAELGKIGSNVNQIARELNRKQDIEPDMKAIDYTLTSLDTLTRQLITLLSHGH